MELKFSPETAREWNKSLGKSREFASYEEMYDFLTICTRGCSNEMSTSDAVDTRQVSPRLIAYRYLRALIVPDLTTWLHVTTFFQSQSRSAVRLLRRSKFASIACGRVTLRRNARAGRDVLIHIVASIILCCTPRCQSSTRS